MPEISVIVPVYRVQRYLPHCLDSVLGQTFRDIELICVDDGSPDASAEILGRYADKDSRIRVIHKENGGLSSARNAAYPHVRGRYVLFVDSDDWIDPTLCEKTLRIAIETGADMTLFLFRRTPGFHDPTPLERKMIRNSGKITDRDLVLHSLPAWSKLWKTSFLFENDLRFPEGLYHEDRPVNFKAFLRNPKTAFLPETLYFYRVNENSITRGHNEKLVLDLGRCHELMKQTLLDSGRYHGPWKRLFLESKLLHSYIMYGNIEPRLRPVVRSMILRDFGDDEKEFLDSPNELPWHAGDFYRSLRGSSFASVKTHINLELFRIKQRFAGTVASGGGHDE